MLSNLVTKRQNLPSLFSRYFIIHTICYFWSLSTVKDCQSGWVGPEKAWRDDIRLPFYWNDISFSFSCASRVSPRQEKAFGLANMRPESGMQWLFVIQASRTFSDRFSRILLGHNFCRRPPWDLGRMIQSQQPNNAMGALATTEDAVIGGGGGAKTG